MRNFNKKTFIIISVIFGVLLIPAFLAAWGEDEGTLGTTPILVALSKLFYLLRFPTHTLLWNFFSSNSMLFFFGLMLNCMFYGFVIERLISFLKTSKTT